MSELIALLEAKDWDGAQVKIKESDDVDALLKTTDDAGHTPLYVALWHHAPEPLLLTILDLSDESVVAARNKYKWTALHCAAERGAPTRVVELLVRKHPEALDEKNSEGQTPRMRNGGLRSDPASLGLISKTTTAVMKDQLAASEKECTYLRKQLDAFKQYSEEAIVCLQKALSDLAPPEADSSS